MSQILLLTRFYIDYTERVFSDGSYLASLKGMFLWGSNDRVRGHPNISTNMVVSMVCSSSILITASINGTLKLWSLDTLTSIAAYDIVNAPVPANNSSNAPKPLFSTEPACLISATTSKDGVTYVATYSPLGEGQFRIWRLIVSPATDARVAPQASLTDVLESPIIPTAPDDNAIWMIPSFVLEPSRIKQQKSSSGDLFYSLDLWLLWKSNKSSRVHVLFNIPTVRNPPKSTLIWRAVAPDISSEEDFILPNDDCSEMYLRRIFQPGMYSPAIIETVLPVYEKHYSILNPHDDTASLTLKERVARAVSASVSMQLTTTVASQNSAEESYTRDIQQQWARFDRLCLELSRQGNEAFSLARVASTNAIVVVKATAISHIRFCVGLEHVQLAGTRSTILLSGDATRNRVSLVEHEDVDLLTSFASFSKLLPKPVLGRFTSALIEHTLEPPRYSPGDAAFAIYESCLLDQISDSALDLLQKRLSDIDGMQAAFEACYEDLEFLHSSQASLFGRPALNTRYSLSQAGLLVVVGSTAQAINRTYRAVVDTLLFLAVYSSGEIPDCGIEYEDLFEKFTSLLRSLSYLKTICECLLDGGDNLSIEDEDEELSRGVNKLALDKSKATAKNTTLLELLFSRFSFTLGSTAAATLASPPSAAVGAGLAHAVSYTTTFFSLARSLSSTAAAAGAVVHTRHFQAAKSVLIYLRSDDGVACFAKGLVYLRVGEFDEARMWLAKCVSEMATLTVTDEIILAFRDFYANRSGAVDGVDNVLSEVAGHGISVFAAHVSELLDMAGAYAAACEFGRLAIDMWSRPHGQLEVKEKEHDGLYRAVFESAIKGELYDDAYACISKILNKRL